MRPTLHWCFLLTALLVGTKGLAEESPRTQQVKVTRVPSPACPWLARADSCWAQALSEFDACAPPQDVRGTLYVDGICRYYDGTSLRSDVLQEPPEAEDRDVRTYELKFELRKAGKPCFSFRRKLTGWDGENPLSKYGPKELETEIVTRHGTVRHVQSWDVKRQIELWEQYQRAPHPTGTEVLPEDGKRAPCDPKIQVCLVFQRAPDPRPRTLAQYAWGERSMGVVTCPDRSQVLLGFMEYTECPNAVPMRVVRARPDDHALEFAFVQPQWSKKSIACGPHHQQAKPTPIYFEQQVLLDDSVPEVPIPPPEAGPVPERLMLTPPVKP
ncbi:hypothetical protein ACLESD_02140 [Pyxidicoccus sp. 3LFB2]